MKASLAGRGPAIAGLLLVVALVAGRALVFDLRSLGGHGMTPTFEEGRLLLVSRLARPAAGDVVMLRLSADADRYVKRVLAVEGERVEVVEGEVFVDGRSLRQDDAARRALRIDCGEVQARTWTEARDGRRWTAVPAPESAAAMQVPAGSLWVEGDNRVRGEGSLQWGPVERELVVGVVVASLGLPGGC